VISPVTSFQVLKLPLPPAYEAQLPTARLWVAGPLAGCGPGEVADGVRISKDGVGHAGTLELFA
jgi:hypothetical protein